MTHRRPRLQRLVWLRRRLQRMAPGELPHRLTEALRMLMQRAGIGDARCVPPRAGDARFGPAWCRVPEAGEIDAGSRADLLAAADQLLTAGPTLFGHATAADVHWNADPRSGWTPPHRFGLFIDFRHLPDGVDVKFLWEMNRHVWWLPLAQAWAMTGRRAYLDRLRTLLDGWLAECPYPLGPNWSSPVEHGVRLIVWSLVWHLVGGRASPMFDGAAGAALLDRWMGSVYQHIRFASDNYSRHSSANNHLLGEVAGVFVAAHTWDLWAETRPLREQARRELERELQLQFGADGLNAEQAMCYHKFALQFVLAAALCGTASGDDLSPAAWDRIGLALAAVAALMDCDGNVPMYGDADDGEVFRLDPSPHFSQYAALVAMGAALTARSDVAAKAALVRHAAGAQVAWLLPPTPAPPQDPADEVPAALPTVFSDAGIVLLGDALHTPHELRAQFDVGPLGYHGIAGHGHADALSLQLSVGGEPLLVDPGTYCYNTEPAWRHFFRSTRAHNTLEVDGCDQSIYGGSFLWLRDVACTVDSLRDDGDSLEVVAHHTGYGHLRDPVVHHRRVRLDRAARRLEVEDWLGCAEPHDVAWHWHAPAHARVEQVPGGGWRVAGRVHALLIEALGDDLSASVVQGASSPPQGWVSDRFYHRAPAPVLVVSSRLRPGQRVLTRLQVI
ncbi:alginate lyase family protein [Ideonella sp. A 288]|uniref:heparinase II/III family protein n=1 Tax=Ideonella sp. A 288 TaxID=1962181 RepID=UPI0013037178|nr:alginate lyase family protein [Ideonella sp. A 288]